MRLIDADKLYPDCLTKDGKLAISQSQLANVQTVAKLDTNDIEYKAYCKGLEDGRKIIKLKGKWVTGFDKNNNIQLYCNLCGEKAQIGCIEFCGSCGADMRGENNEKNL